MSQEKKKKKKDNIKFEVFTIPFSSNEFRGDINIKTNIENKQSKEEIILQAYKFHSQGNISEAERYYKYFINHGFEDYKVFYNYGILLKENGRLDKAELITRKAIKLNPNYAEAYNNLGTIFSFNGKFKEAEIITRKAIRLEPRLAEAYSNLGTIIKNDGRIIEAESLQRKAIKIKPDLAEAYSNLGNIMRDYGKLKEAESLQRKAINISPKSGTFYSNLGAILIDLSKTTEATNAYIQAIKFNPKCASYYCSLGSVLIEMGEIEEAFNYHLKAIEIEPNNSTFYSSITNLLRDYHMFRFNKSRLRRIIYILLGREDINHNLLFNTLKYLYNNEIIKGLELLDSNFLNSDLFNLLIKDKIMISALKKITFRDFNLEIKLTKIRRLICFNIANKKTIFSKDQLTFINALAQQCFLNEYIYSESIEERKYIDKLIEKYNSTRIDEQTLSIIACYSPLHKLTNIKQILKSIDSITVNLKELISLQVLEPLNEIELSVNIKKIGSISNNISRKVQSQYEKNPYPRWRYGDHSNKSRSSKMVIINNEIYPNLIKSHQEDDNISILIAGCGTGNQILHANNYRNATITAIDLSSSSLAFSQRKINEMGITNVNLIQMDLLEIFMLKEKFDVILCSGVLHHMSNPMQGLKTLLKVLKTNGYMKLGLYSELARYDIIKARKYIAKKGLKATKKNIQSFREKVINNELPDLGTLKLFPDFYSLSEMRDLCFHIQEHRFTINQLRKIIRLEGLKFHGFHITKSVKTLYKKDHPEDLKQTNLNNWEEFEYKYPTTFHGMYQFWISKRK